MEIHTWLCFPLHAVAAMFLGMDLPGLALPGPWKTYVMLGFVAWHVGAEIVLEVHAYRLSRKGTARNRCPVSRWRAVGFPILRGAAPGSALNTPARSLRARNWAFPASLFRVCQDDKLWGKQKGRLQASGRTSSSGRVLRGSGWEAVDTGSPACLGGTPSRRKQRCPESAQGRAADSCSLLIVYRALPPLALPVGHSRLMSGPRGRG